MVHNVLYDQVLMRDLVKNKFHSLVLNREVGRIFKRMQPQLLADFLLHLFPMEFNLFPKSTRVIILEQPFTVVG